MKNVYITIEADTPAMIDRIVEFLRLCFKLNGVEVVAEVHDNNPNKNTDLPMKVSIAGRVGPKGRRRRG